MNAESKSSKETKETKETKEAKESKSLHTHDRNSSSSESSSPEKPVKKSIKRLAVLESMPIVELSSHSGNLFDAAILQEQEQAQPQTLQTTQTTGETPFFTITEQQLLSDARQTMLMIDVEACDAIYGPVLAIGCALGVYRDYMKYEILRRDQWIINRSIKDLSGETKRFWLGPAIGAWTYYANSSTPMKLTEKDAAIGFRKYLNMLWKHVPNLCILVDSVHVDLTLLNNMLVSHKQKPLHYDHLGKYQHAVYVSRDLLRGSYACFDSEFAQLQKPGLNKAINECWKRLVGYGNRIHVSQKGHDLVLHGRMEKHYCVWDAVQQMMLTFQMEDIRLHYEMRFPRVALCPAPYPSSYSHPNVVYSQSHATPLYTVVSTAVSASSGAALPVPVPVPLSFSHFPPLLSNPSPS